MTVQSCDSPHAYIATQAPLPSTFGHFWSMVWQERINVVVVITNLVEDGKVRYLATRINREVVVFPIHFTNSA